LLHIDKVATGPVKETDRSLADKAERETDTMAVIQVEKSDSAIEHVSFQ